MDLIIDGSFSLKIETEEDILILAELIQRKNGRKLWRIPKGTSLVQNYANKQPRQASEKVSKGRAVKVIESHRKMLDLIKANYPQGSFQVSEAAKLIKKELKLRRTSAGNAIITGVKTGELCKVKHGVYIFRDSEIDGTRCAPDDFLFLESNKPAIFLDVLRIIKAMSDKVALVIQKDAIHCVLNDSQGHMALDVKLERSLFASYHINTTAIELTADAGALIERLQRLEGSISLAIIHEHASLLQIGKQFNLAIEGLKSLDNAIVNPAEPIQDFKSEVVIDRQQLERMLSDNRVNSDYVDILAEKDKLVLQSFNEAGDCKREITSGYYCKEPSRSRLYYLDYLIKCLKASKCENVKLKYNGNFLMTEFIIDPSVKVSLYLTCKMMQEEKKLAM